MSYFEPKRKLTINDAIEDYLNYKKATGTLSQSSLINRKYEYYRLKKFCDSKQIEFVIDIHKNLITSYLSSLNIQKSSKSHILFILSSFFDYLVENELVLDNLASSIEKPKHYLPKTDFLTLKELDQLFTSEAKNSPKKVVDRNILMFAIMVDLCLRVSEVINLKFTDVRIDNKEVWVRRKRDKIDNIPINDYIVEKFLNWYAVRPDFKGNESDFVFLSTHGQKLQPRQVHQIVSKALTRAGIVKRKCGPHLLRHSGASLKAQAGENIVMIQYLLGHENISTTKRYLHFNREALKDLINKCSIAKYLPENIN